MSKMFDPNSPPVEHRHELATFEDPPLVYTRFDMCFIYIVPSRVNSFSFPCRHTLHMA